jgi:hypothetical protein
VHALFTAEPDPTIAELQSRLAAAGIAASRSAIGRSLLAAGLTRKMSQHAAEQDRADVAAARRAWRARQPALNPERLVFLDETWATTALARRYGERAEAAGWWPPCPIKRRTHVVRIFPNAESCLRLIRALAVEMHENWLEAHRYLSMDDLCEHKKEALRMAAQLALWTTLRVAHKGHHRTMIRFAENSERNSSPRPAPPVLPRAARAATEPGRGVDSGGWRRS